MNARVLVIEDNSANRYLARFVLEAHGLRVEEATNGAEGVKRALAGKPDLVIMDIEMPEMDGYEAAERIHADPTMARVPIMAFTSYAHPRDRARALARGFADYVEKPFDVDDFVRRVVRLLPNSQPPSS